ncbi:Crp/Fnr family transcriptional regulator [Sphingomonas sp. MG17]|uniref:Crp/Fnr family transcriptional regulator n=1 Tax=Sphingomonas tagetis TaxID=2949092 RepID=A0A9X2HMV4_9SPHN|nr:Crp/Fnr family transcriptional regulator [Sphingomonas tagetis]MCP3731361.1 Crp/Fnr family transcriptional regulator [Sphingomonas tagetis]
MGQHADEMLLDMVESRTAAGTDLPLLDSPSNRLLALIVEGSARVYTTSAQGRQATVRYVEAGDVIGLATLLAPTSIEDGDAIGVQAMNACHVLRLSTQRFRQIVARDPDIMWGLCTELAYTLMSSHHMLADNVFQPVRSRVARHLLDMAKRLDGKLVVHASPQDIADAIGSVREVVSRATVRLRSEGVIQREGTAHVIADPRMLHRIAEEA